MSWGDVRGLLQYVPQFSGKVFVIIVDTPVTALAETMLDLLSLQSIGVRLVIGSTVHTKEDLLDRAAEVELKFCNSHLSLSTQPEKIAESLKRGQSVILDLSNEQPFSEAVVSLSCAISAKKIIYLQGDGQLPSVGAIPAAEINEGSDPLLIASARACQSGVPRVHVLDGSELGVLLAELFSNEGVGTMVYADSYRVIRPIRVDDIVELLGMIGRSVRNSHLVPRYYADVESNLDDYFVMEIDGNVVGSIALYKYDDSDLSEVACLYVKQNHEGQGYASELVMYAQEHARKLGHSKVFSLTNRVADFFQNKMGYQEVEPNTIPLERQQQLLASGRDSRVFCLEL